MNKLYDIEFISKINNLTNDKLKEEIKNELKNIDPQELIVINFPFETSFSTDWNNFVKTGFVSSHIVDCYFENLKFKSSNLGTPNEKWALTSKFFHTGSIFHTCSKTGWTVHFELNNQFLPFFNNNKYIKLSNEIFQRYEMSKIFCLENIRAVTDAWESMVKTTTDEDKNNYLKKMHNIVKELLMKLDKTNLPKINTHGYKVPFFEAWNSFTKDQPVSENDWYYLTFAFGMDLNSRKREIKNQHTEFVPMFYFSSDPILECRETGTKFNVRFTHEFNWEILQWQPEIIKKDNGEKVYWGKHIPIQPINFVKNKIYKKEIVLKTGNLIVADWFRFENDFFNKIIDKECEELAFNSINNSQGRVFQISSYAEKLNFASVNIGNTCPSVYKIDNRLFFGSGSDEEEESDKFYLGYVTTDLWNVSIIEEEHLQLLLTAHGMSSEESIQNIIKLKQKTLNIKVDPGVYVINFMGDYKEFHKKYKKTFPKNITPYFTFEKK